MAGKTFKIGNIVMRTPFVLAPLAGITDKSMRSLCTKQGASLVYTEMVSAKGLWYKDKKTDSLLAPYEGEDNLGFQLFGSDPEIMGYAAETLRDRPNLLLDLNSGCPVPKIVKNGEGSALLRDTVLLHDVVEAMVKKAGKPVTVKIRKGFSKDDDVAVEAAKAAEAAGAAAVTVHGRTREQYYEGRADWTVIERVKKALSIPVIGNGDVFTGEDAVRLMDETGCDGVMIARGALGNPWIFREAEALWKGEDVPERPSDSERVEALLQHLLMIAGDKGEGTAVREIRKHVGWYVKGMRGAASVRRRVNETGTLQGMRELLSELI